MREDRVLKERCAHLLQLIDGKALQVHGERDGVKQRSGLREKVRASDVSFLTLCDPAARKQEKLVLPASSRLRRILRSGGAKKRAGKECGQLRALEVRREDEQRVPLRFDRLQALRTRPHGQRDTSCRKTEICV